jgi:O-antigen/teichoic acid export membrane protein
MGPTEPQDPGTELTRGGLLARNTLLNIGATLLLLGAAGLAIPLLVDELGTSRFGLLALAWAAIGTFGVLDLGIGRALTREVARRLSGDGEPVEALVSTFLAILALLGLVGGIALLGLASVLVTDVLEVPAALEGEATRACRLLAVAIPVVMVTTGLRGILEAHQRFDLVNALRVPVGVLTLAGPLLVLPFSDSITAAVAVLVAVRVLSLVGHAVFCVRSTGLRAVPPRRGLVMPALRSAGWLTVANLIQPLMMYPDRFIVGAVVSASAVAFYAAPHDLATKLVVLPAAPIPVLFPAFATSFHSDPARTARIFTRSVRYMAVFVAPLVLVTVTFAEEGMRAWLGSDFAGESARVLQLLAIGVLCQSLAQIPFALLQGAGRADLTAKLLLAELGPFLLGLWLAVRANGIEGAAAVWLARSLVDAALLYVFAARLLSLPRRDITHAALAFAALLLLTAALVPLPFEALGKAIVLGLALALFAVIAWTRVLSSEERRRMVKPLRPTKA